MPRFLERDEAEREAAVPPVSLGRRPQRAAVLALRHDGRRRRVLDCSTVMSTGRCARVLIELAGVLVVGGTRRGSRAVAAVARARIATASCRRRRCRRRGPTSRRVKWTQPVGEGYSSPVVDDERVFVHSRTDPDEVVSAFELDSGEADLVGHLRVGVHQEQVRRCDGEGAVLDPAGRERARSSRSGTSAVLSSFDAATGALEVAQGLVEGDRHVEAVHRHRDVADHRQRPAHRACRRRRRRRAARARSGDRRREVGAAGTWTRLRLADRHDVRRRPAAGHDDRQGGGGRRGRSPASCSGRSRSPTSGTRTSSPRSWPATS